MIVRHEPVLDGVSTTAYFASDFTLAEIRTLRAVQSNAARSKQYDGLYAIPTLDEVIALAKSEGAKAGRPVGIYPEIKHSTFHATVVGFGANTFEDKLLATLHVAYGNSASAPVFIQSFEVGNLQYLNGKTSIRLVQLVDADDVNADGSMSLVEPYRQPYDFVVKGDARTFADLLTDSGLDFVETCADAVGPWKPYLVRTVNDGLERTGDATLNIEAAHRKGLLVHTWTFRNDASGYGFNDPQAEMTYYLRLGVDGVFTDFPATGVAARSAM